MGLSAQTLLVAGKSKEGGHCQQFYQSGNIAACISTYIEIM